MLNAVLEEVSVAGSRIGWRAIYSEKLIGNPTQPARIDGSQIATSITPDWQCQQTGFDNVTDGEGR
jgi:hypothetical protein